MTKITTLTGSHLIWRSLWTRKNNFLLFTAA